MIDFITQDERETLIFEKGIPKCYDRREGIITYISHQFLKDIKMYQVLVRRYTSVKRNIPMYFSKNLYLFKISVEKKNYYINYSAIFYIGYTGSILKIVFKNLSVLNISCTYKKIKEALTRVDKITTYLNDINRLYC